jgi:hypothetical protein
MVNCRIAPSSRDNTMVTPAGAFLNHPVGCLKAPGGSVPGRMTDTIRVALVNDYEIGEGLRALLRPYDLEIWCRTRRQREAATRG